MPNTHIKDEPEMQQAKAVVTVKYGMGKRWETKNPESSHLSCVLSES